MRKAVLTTILAITVLSLTGCYNHWTGEEEGAGNVTISIRGASKNSRAALYWFLEDEYISSLKHTITLYNGPGTPQTKNILGVGSVNFSVIPGDWNIKVEAFITRGAEDLLKVANYSGSVGIKPGYNKLEIKMDVITGITAPVIYTITGSENHFMAKTPDGVMVGNGAIQAVIDGIRTDAGGSACYIEFGDGGVLNIGEDFITFNGGANPVWGNVTLIGSLTSANNIAAEGTIYLVNGASIESKANITNTGGSDSKTINNNGGGKVTISGGAVSSGVNGYAFYSNYSTNVLNISGGIVSATGPNGVAVQSNTNVTISGGLVTSAHTGVDSTIVLTLYGVMLEMTGGTVENTAINANSVAISVNPTSPTYNPEIKISGGTVKATGSAIINNYGTVNISGTAIVSSTTGSAVENSHYPGKTTVSGTATVTSANTNPNSGTIRIGKIGTAANVERLIISGGTVKNTATGANGNAIYHDSIGAVTISAGTVSTTATSGYAVFNTGGGTLNIAPAATIVGKVTP